MVTNLRSDELDDNVVEQVLTGQSWTSGDLRSTSQFVSAIRSMSETTPAVVRVELVDIFENGLASGPAPKTTRRPRVLKSASALLATVTGKVVIGSVAFAAGVGGAQAGGVVDVPGLPDPAPTTAENAPANDGAGDHSGRGSDGDAGKPDGAGVDGDSVSDRAKNGEPQEDGRGFGSSVSEDATDGTPAEDTPAEDRPVGPGEAGSDAPAGGSDTADQSRPDSTRTGRP